MSLLFIDTWRQVIIFGGARRDFQELVFGVIAHIFPLPRDSILDVLLLFSLGLISGIPMLVVDVLWNLSELIRVPSDIFFLPWKIPELMRKR